MGPSQKPNVCRRLSRRALGFFSRDAGVVQRTNLGILRALVCQVTARRPGAEPGTAGRLAGGGARGGSQASGRGAVFTQYSPVLRRSPVMGRVIQALNLED